MEGKLLETSFVYFIIYLSQTPKSHEWENVGLVETKTINQTKTPTPQSPIFNTGISQRPAEDVSLLAQILAPTPTS